MKLTVGRGVAERKITVRAWDPANIMVHKREISLRVPVKNAEELESFRADALDMYETAVDLEWGDDDWLVTLYDVEVDADGKMVSWSVHTLDSRDEPEEYSGVGITFRETGRYNREEQRKLHIERSTIENLEAEAKPS